MLQQDSWSFLAINLLNILSQWISAKQENTLLAHTDIWIIKQYVTEYWLDLIDRNQEETAPLKQC